MWKSLRRTLSTLCVGAILFTTAVSSIPTNVEAVAPVKDTITISFMFPDTVGENFGVEPTNPNLIYDMIKYPDNYPERTGWSGVAYSCSNGEWQNDGSYNTVDSHTDYYASDFRDEIVSQYGQEIYDLAVASGEKLVYDENSEIPTRFKNASNNPYKGTGRYVIYSDDDVGKKMGNPCQPGEKSYYYNNLDFYVTMTFDVFWKEPANREGNAKGRAYWELERTDSDAPSEVASYSEFEVPYERHVGVRKIKQKTEIGNKVVQQQDSSVKEPKFGKNSYAQMKPIEFYVNAKQAKDKYMIYSFEYEYTNKEIGWVCGALSCWYDDSPDWRAVQTYNLEGSIPVDHSQGETEKWTKLDDLLKTKWIVGREDSYDPSKSSKVYHEEWERSSSNDVPTSFNLKTQSTLPILQGALDYSVELPSGKHLESSFNPLLKEQSVGYYFPADIDDSLKSDYENDTDYDYDYAIPLQQHIMKNKGESGNKRTFEMDYTTDLFFISQYTGFLEGVPYAKTVNQSVKSGSSIPNASSFVNQGTTKVKRGFENSTGEDFVDSVLSLSQKDMQRYYLPVAADSKLHPNKTYKNHIVYENMGLSDGIFEFDQTFEFDHYLFGSAGDDAWIVEQVDSSNENLNYNHKVVIENEQLSEFVSAKNERTDVRMHGFRFSDRDFADVIKSMIGLDL